MDPLNAQHTPETKNPAPLRRVKRLAWLAAGLTLCFALPLYELFRFALHSSLYSHILLVPCISLYLVWLKRKELPAEFQPARLLALSLAILGVLSATACLFAAGRLELQDRLSLLTLGYLLLFWGGCAWRLGRRTLRALGFPLAFLVCMVPLPVFLENGFEAFLQHASAQAAELLLTLSGTPVFREATLLTLPGLSVEVAPECSGIRSTFVLLITALLAGHFFLRRRRTITTLVLAVILLGIARNAARIFILAQLFFHGHPEIFDSPLHHRGGPLFFAASLVPCFLLIWFLRKLDLRARPSAQRQAEGNEHA